MARSGPRAKLRKALKRAGRFFGRGLLAVLTGCRAPGVPYTAEPGALTRPRQVVIAQQALEDSAVEVVNRPLGCAWDFLNEAADHLCALAEGSVGKHILLPLQGTPAPICPSHDPLDLAELEEQLRQVTGADLDPANVQLYLDGRQALSALEDLIGRAEERIDVLMFNWDSDALGEAIAARLAARAGPNLRVRVLVDGGGNLFFGEPSSLCASGVNRVLASLAQHPYIDVVRIRNPFGRYDHRKLVLVDGRLAWTGGRNFTRDAFFAHHDLSFVFDGPLVGQLQETFDRHWVSQSGPPVEPLRQVLRQTCARSKGSAPEPNTLARLVHSEPNNRQMARALYRAVDLARNRIYIENVYLCDSRLVYRLCQARRRGVDVRVILTFTSTTGVINGSNRVVANRLLAAGVRVYVYPGMTHVKAATVDGCWAYIGTGNFDALSLRRNYEVGLSVTACPLIAQLEERLFLPDLKPEWELTEPVPVGFCDYLCEMVASLWL